MIDPPKELEKWPELNGDRSADVFLEISGELSDKDYWSLLRWVWIRHGGSIARSNAQERLLLCGRSCQNDLMTPGEQETFSKLPDIVEVFHGTSLSSQSQGWSWSRDYNKAYGFARKHFHDGYKVVRGKCERKDIIAYFSEYDEEEIVIHPDSVFEKNELSRDDLF